MQNLLAAIASGKLGSSAATSNVKDILDEVQAYRDTKAADAFYETLDRTLNDLKASPESLAFRNPVKKSEAPDYDLVIKNPMDLSTMQKKVKTRIYENKAEFADDLNLIWDNCLLYNTDDTHPLRRLAVLMKRRADHILDAIADIGDIKLLSKPKPKAKMSQKERERLRERDRARAKMQERKKLNGDSISSGKPLSSAGTSGWSLSHLFGGQIHALGSKESDNGSESRQQTAPVEEPHVEPQSFPSLPPRTAASMAQFLAMRNAPYHSSSSSHVNGVNGTSSTSYGVAMSFHGYPLFASPDEAVAYPPERKRKRTRAEAFDEAQAEALAAVQQRRQQSEAVRGEGVPNGKGKGVGLNDDLLQDWWGDMMKPELLCAGVPELDDVDLEESAELPPRKRSRRSLAKKSKHKSISGRKETLRTTIESNISTLHEVRKVKEKLARIAELKDGNQSDDMEVEIEPPEPLPQPDDPPRPGYYLRPEDGIQNSCYSLLRHAGFEGASRVALDVINSVAGDYIKNIGRSMRHYLDTHSNDMPSEEIVLHTLFENGVTEVNQLERYVRDDVQRYGGRLQEILRKLQVVHREQTEKEVGDDEDFDEEDEIMGGGLEDILNEDYFGFKAMGLADELGIANLTLPRQFLSLRPKKSAVGAAAKKAKEPPAKVLPYPPPPPFIPITEETVEKQIGLLRDFYKSKLVASAAPASDVKPFGDTSDLNPGALAPAVIPSFPGTAPDPALDGKRRLPEDPGNAKTTKIGPKGEILLNAPPPGGKKKKAKTEKGAGSEPPAPPLPAPAPIQPKPDESYVPAVTALKLGSASPALHVAIPPAVTSPDKRNLHLPPPAPLSRANSGSVSPIKASVPPRPPSASTNSQQKPKLAPSIAVQPPSQPPQGPSQPMMPPQGWPGPPYWPQPMLGNGVPPGPAPLPHPSLDAARGKSRGRGLPGSAPGRGAAARGLPKGKVVGRMPPAPMYNHQDGKE